MLNPKLKALAGKIQDHKLRQKVVELMQDPSFTINEKKFSNLELDICPAGLSHHHAYPGGYIEHVVSTGHIAMALCDSVEEVYRGKVKRDIVIAGVLLHDIYKPATYRIDENGRYVSTRLADYLDHASLATAELVRRDFPLELIHVVSSHKGEYAPIRPRTIEAMICHLADMVDARLNGDVYYSAAYLLRMIGEEMPLLNSKDAFDVVAARTARGETGVKDAFKKIMHKRQTHNA